MTACLCLATSSSNFCFFNAYNLVILALSSSEALSCVNSASLAAWSNSNCLYNRSWSVSNCNNIASVSASLRACVKVFLRSTSSAAALSAAAFFSAASFSSKAFFSATF
mgnify:CR=1 FL=1